MSLPSTRQQRRALKRLNEKEPTNLAEIPRDRWVPSHVTVPMFLTRVWRSHGFLVQQYEEPGTPVRLSINRTELEGGGSDRWRDGITWDEIQALKRQAGYGEHYACELFPADRDLVNVANVRHIWLLPDAPPFAWRRP